MSDSIEKYTKRGIRNSYVSTIVGISLVLFLIGLVLSGSIALNSIQKQAKESIQGDVFFTPDMKDTDIKQIEKRIAQWPEFNKVWFVSAERAVEAFTGDGEKDIQSLFEEENPLPPSLCFSPKAEFATKSGMNKIKTKLLNAYKDEIDEVSYDPASVENVNLGFRQFAFVFLTIALLLIMIAVAMINNTIRMSLYARRFTIKTMHLVGATSRFVRKPFLRQAVLNGVVSAFIALILLVTVFYALNNTLETIELTFTLTNLLILISSLVVMGVFITFVSTWIALNKYLRMKLDKLY